MKQSAAKTLGVAALGAAFAAVGAGAANAAPVAQGSAQNLNQIARTLPAEHVASVLPPRATRWTRARPTRSPVCSAECRRRACPRRA
ncbi:hypothetical protein [Streptomyces sp. SCL15-6]|uniref:hypothetical protein n=1 Tax=Streptomyces sp. SCL15-6 TaxID=2967222 RepID=UPI0039902816